MAPAQERYLNSVEIEVRDKIFVGGLADLNEAIFNAEPGRVFDDGLIFKSRQRAAYFFEIVCAENRRVLIHQADKNFVAERRVKPIDNFNRVASEIRQNQMADDNSANNLPANKLRGSDEFKPQHD